MSTNLGKRWNIASLITPQANEALASFSPIMRQVLFNRGYATDAAARSYLNGEANFDTSPMQMKGILETVKRLRIALDQKEFIAVYGDYDVDGVTATALLVEVLSALGGNVKPYIPNRFEEGYGLNKDALTTLKGEGVNLVISVDCGIRSPDEAIHALSLGLDLIISDHHQPANGDLPAAYSVVNPKQVNDLYPDKDLAGVGVAYKIVQALLESFGNDSQGFQIEDLLDLVALGTVADLAPLTGENRSLVRKGLKRIRETKRQGLFSLAAVSDLPLSRVTCTSIGFILGPRLNAAGRLESALAAFDLLTTKDVKTAGELAQQLNVQNRQRQEITRKIQAEAELIVLAGDPATDLFFAVDPDFNAGVVGLAASRLVETYYRPAVVGQVSNETTRCSCRSIPEFHITEALDQCSDLLVRYGGHAAAAGFTVKNENLDLLRIKLKSLAAHALHGKDLRQTLTADAILKLSDINWELLHSLELLQPTGYGNPEAVFVSQKVRVSNKRTVGADSKHLKLVLNDDRITFDAIGFRLGHLVQELPTQVDVLYTLESNEYNGRQSLQLNLKDVRPSNPI
ncbi:MAG: single-stranded-DNA-specific exonuclease RecJ [Anaerolineales bacterium]